MFSNDRSQLRRFYLEAHQKAQTGAPLSALEHLVAEIVGQHPEYHAALREDALDRDWTPEQGETNPFLHMGMHISLHEQLQSNQLPELRGLYQQIVAQAGDAHAAEHQMMECLGLVLWEAQRAGRAPDDQAYLNCLRRLLPGA